MRIKQLLTKTLLVAAGLFVGASAWADTTIANLTATQVTAFDGATKASASDYSVWTKESGPTATSGNNSFNWSTGGTYVLWSYKLTGDGLVISQTISGAAAGTYLLKTYMHKNEGTASVTITRGESELATYSYTKTAGTYYVPFYNDAAGDIKFTYSFNGGGSINWGNDYLYSIKEGDATENYTTILSSAISSQIESMIAGMSEAKKALKDILESANTAYTDYASAVGSGIFQYQSSYYTALGSAISTAQVVYGNAESTDEQYAAQTTALTAAYNNFFANRNLPDAEKYYYIKNTASEGIYYLNLSDDYTEGVGRNRLSTLPYAVQFEAATAGKYYIKSPAGKYIYAATTWENGMSTESKAEWTVVTNGDGTISFYIQTGYLWTPWSLNTATSVGKTNNASQQIAVNWTVTEAGKESVTANITSALWSTFVAPFEVTLPEGITAYTCTYDAETSTLTTTPLGTQTITANTAVLLNSASTLSQTFQGYAVSHYTGWCNSNSLVGTLEAKTLDIDGTVYLLQKQGEVVGWYKYDGTNSISSTANRAYLYVPAATPAREFLPLFGDDETTGITQVNGEDVKVNGYYNLSGQRVSQPAKGLYIVGGKKVMVK